MIDAKVGDKVKCENPTGGLAPYTGTIDKVFVGFVRVIFDKPQGHKGMRTQALTSPANLKLLERDGKPFEEVPVYGAAHPIVPVNTYSVDNPMPAAGLLAKLKERKDKEAEADSEESNDGKPEDTQNNG